MKRFFYSLIGRELLTFLPYFERTIQLRRLAHDDGSLAATLEQSSAGRVRIESVEAVEKEPHEATRAYLLNGNFNYTFDIEGELRDLAEKLDRTSRLVLVQYNPYLAWVYRLGGALGLRKSPMPTTFVTMTNLLNLCRLAGFEIERARNCVYFPFPVPLVSQLINALLPVLPFFSRFSFVSTYVLRPVVAPAARRPRPKLSVVIPARNERGNIEAALQRMPDLNCPLEIIYVEGHSQDGTWEEIQRVLPLYADRFELKAFRQTGKGKNDAVQLGFAEATGDVLTILDADLTMPPEMLGRFYEAYVSGKADFVNGSRLVYPMEGEAMRFLNLLGNIFFAKALSYVLGTRLGDSLCGTKLMSRKDYARIRAWNRDFGKFDPFGDFELLFPAGVLGLGVINVPIRYLARTYGSTNISRFRHGAMLAKMTLIGFFRIRLGKV